MRINYIIAQALEGTLGELLADLPIPPGANIPPPSLEEVVQVLGQLCFIVETVAHLQGKERAMLPTADAGRAIIERLKPIELVQG